MSTQECTISAHDLITLSPIYLPDEDANGNWNGVVTPSFNGPSTSGGIMRDWTIKKDWGTYMLASTMYNFVGYCGGWDKLYSPYTLNGSPSGMYFFFGLKVDVTRPGGLFVGSTTIYVGQGKHGLHSPWWVGGPDFSVAACAMAYLNVANQVTCSNVTSVLFGTDGDTDDIVLFSVNILPPEPAADQERDRRCRRNLCAVNHLDANAPRCGWAGSLLEMLHHHYTTIVSLRAARVMAV